MTTSPKLKYAPTVKTPGPGDYKTEDEFSNGSSQNMNKKGFSFNRASTRNYKSIMPGPGTYESEVGNSL
jgi:hypothetical protein